MCEECTALRQLVEIRLQECMRQEMAKEQAEAEVERLREELGPEYDAALRRAALRGGE